MTEHDSPSIDAEQRAAAACEGGADAASRDRAPLQRGDGGNGKAPNPDDSERSEADRSGKGGDPDGKKEDGETKSRLPLINLGTVILLAAVAGGISWYLSRNQESTDDAYTEGRAVSMTARVQGYVTDLDVDDNQMVRAGDLLIRIDQRDYIDTRDQASANLDLSRAQLRSAQLDLDIARVQAPANLKQAEAQLAQSRANQQQAQLEYKRQQAVDPRATTQSSIDTATAQQQTSGAAVQSAEAQVQVAGLVQQNIALAEAMVRQRDSAVRQAEASLAQAEVNLSYTELRAPQDGRVTRRNVERGNFASAGQQVMYIVTDDLWVTANFKESQLNRMRPGQKVRLDVDAYPDLDRRGRIDSIQAGSGARFSAFPAENATGNFVKIVRRVPVKIIIDSGLDPKLPLPLGLSVVPTVTLE